MKFVLTPILAEMKKLYTQVISRDRFEKYINKLQGQSKGDLIVPIMGFNPMAKDHIMGKVKELEDLEVEVYMAQIIDEFNTQIGSFTGAPIEVVLNLADDQKGGWTNLYTTDFDSKFKINALVSRNFCTPYFYTSENYSKQLIKRRTISYMSRTLYWKTNPKPHTLKDHLSQEIFVESFNSKKSWENTDDFGLLKELYTHNKESEDYSLIFNFFYGDKASESLGYNAYGVKNKTGFDYANMLAHK